MNCVRYIFILIIFSSPLIAQQHTVTGEIHGMDQPVPFAEVWLANSKVYTTTNAQGAFEIPNLRNGKYLLRVSAAEFQSFQMEVILDENFQTFLTIELVPIAQELQAILLESEQSVLQRNTPYNLSSINLQGVLRQNHPNGIMGMLRQEPGVHGAEMGQGIVKPFIRGLGFSRVVSIFQGNKLENHQWGADHGLGINDLGVKAVEIIKGPASVLYGSGALGGVLITKDEDAYQKNNKLTGSLSTSMNSLSNGFRSTTSLGGNIYDGWFAATELGYEQHADYKSGNGRHIGNSRFRVGTFRLHTGLNTRRSNHKISFTYNAQQLGIISDTEMQNEHSLATNDWDYSMQLPYQEIQDYLLSYSQSIDGQKLDSYFHLSHHVNQRKEIESDMDAVDLGIQQQHTFLNGRVRLKHNKQSHQLGVQSSLIRSDNYDSAMDFLIPDAHILETGFFYLGSLHKGPYFLQAALRYDYRKVTAYANKKHFINYGFTLPGEPESRKLSKSFSGFTGSFGATRQFGKQHSIKMNLATGFRAPDLAELFSNGPHPGTSRFEKGNMGFKREQSYQLDWQYEFRTDQFQTAVSVYGMKLQDYIFFRATGETNNSNGLEIWSYSQEDAIFYGIDVEASWKMNNRLSSKLTGSLIRAQEKVSSEPLNMIPPDNLRVEVSYRALQDHSLQITSQWYLVAPQNKTAPTEQTTPGYGLLHLMTSKSFSLGKKRVMEVAITAENIFNQRYVDHLSLLRPFDIPSTGRNIQASLKYSF